MIIIIEHISKLKNVKSSKCYLIKYSFGEGEYTLDISIKSDTINQQYTNTYQQFNKLCADLCSFTFPTENYKTQVRIFSGKDMKKIFKLNNVKYIDKFNTNIINYIKIDKPIIRLKKGSFVKADESYLRTPIKQEENIKSPEISINTSDKEYIIELENRLAQMIICKDVKQQLSQNK